MSYKFNPFTSNLDLDTTGASSPVFTVNSISTNTNAVANNTYFIDCNGGVVQLTLPTPASGTYVVVKDETGSSNTNNITIARNGSESIEGVAANYVVDSDFAYMTFLSDGTDWVIV